MEGACHPWRSLWLLVITSNWSALDLRLIKFLINSKVSSSCVNFLNGKHVINLCFGWHYWTLLGQSWKDALCAPLQLAHLILCTIQSVVFWLPVSTKCFNHAATGTMSEHLTVKTLSNFVAVSPLKFPFYFHIIDDGKGFY